MSKKRLKGSAKPSSPSFKFDRVMTQNIESTPQPIFVNERHTCLIDSILLTNITETDIYISLYVLYEEGELTPSAIQHFLHKNTYVPAQKTLELGFGEGLSLQAGDILFASSNYHANLFNAYVCYREIQEN